MKEKNKVLENLKDFILNDTEEKVLMAKRRELYYSFICWVNLLFLFEVSDFMLLLALSVGKIWALLPGCIVTFFLFLLIYNLNNKNKKALIIQFLLSAFYLAFTLTRMCFVTDVSLFSQGYILFIFVIRILLCLNAVVWISLSVKYSEKYIENE